MAVFAFWLQVGNLVHNCEPRTGASLRANANNLGLPPGAKRLLSSRGIANPLAPPGLQGKAGEECCFGHGSGGAPWTRVLDKQKKNRDHSTTYEYRGTVVDAFSFMGSPLAFRRTSFRAIETVDHFGHLISSHIQYHDRGLNVTFLGVHGNRESVENVVEVTTQRTNHGYKSAVCTYDRRIFIADTTSDGWIEHFQRADSPPPTPSRSALMSSQPVTDTWDVFYH